MTDDSKQEPIVERLQEGQQFKALHGSQQRSQQPSTSKSQLGDASAQNPFATNINVVADTPDPVTPSPSSPADSPPSPPAPSDPTDS